MSSSIFQALRIDTVDTSQRLVHCTDKTNASVDATYRDVDAAFQIPAPGEIWTAHQNSYEWILDRRQDTPEEQATMVSHMAPGDTRLLSQGTLHISALAVTLNGVKGTSGQAPVIQNDGSLAYATVATGGGTSAVPVVTPVNSSYTIQTTDNIILVDCSTVVCTISLPAAQANGTIKEVKDRYGYAVTNHIAVNAADAATIDGAATYTMSSNFQSNSFVCYASAWYVI